MNLRFYTVYLALLTFTEVAAAANNAAWDCEQGKNGEWTCLNQGQASQPAVQPKVIRTTPPKDIVQQQRPTVAPEAPSTPVVTQVSTTPTVTQEPRIQQATQPATDILQQNQPPLTPQVSEAATASGVAQEPLDQQTAQPSTEELIRQAVPEVKKTRVRFSENQKPVLETTPPQAEPSTRVAKNPGWSCQTGEETANWNCNLVGPDPKGEAQVAKEVHSNSYWFTPAYDNQQERTFQVLRGEFEQDPWQNCASWSAKKTQRPTTSKETRESADTDVTSDFSEVFDGEILNFAGNVDLKRADQHLLASKASYDTVADTMDAQGNVIYSEDTLAVSGNTASMSLGKDEARIRDSQFILAEAPFRGTADIIYRDSKSLSRYQEATFTSCPPGNQDWVAHASKIKINRDSGLGAAKNAWLEFKGVPFLYTPYISFPTDDRRTSGLLSPIPGYTERNGVDIAMPIYWNIAPNYDTIITPRYIEKRGPMLRNEFRYLTDISRGSLAGEFLPDDQLTNKSRYSASFIDNTRFTPRLNTVTNLNYVSDDEYFNDLNNALGFQTNRFLPSDAYIHYGRPDLSFSTGVNHYQSVDKTITDSQMPYDILPRVNLNLIHSFDNMPVVLAMGNQYSHFYHKELVTGQRFNMAPSVSLPIESSGSFVIPKITGQYTQYQLDNLTVPDQDSSVSRILPIISLDSGMMFEKDLHIGSSPYTHTLEPRAFYLYIPRQDQSNIPIFDTAAYDTNFYSLFRENSFGGMDRVQDANQITLAGTSRLIDSKTGLEPLKVSLGQIIYFQDRTIDLDYLTESFPTQTSTFSNLIGEVAGQVSRSLSYTTGAQWDPEENNLARGQGGLRYRNQPDQIFDIGYRYRRKTPNQQSSLSQTQISQSDVSFRWPITAGWYGLGRWQYSFNFNKTTESFVGIEKENCCWRFRVIGRRFINGANTTDFNDPDAKPENAIFVQLELKGLTGLGSNVDDFLQQNLPGYRPAKYFED